MEKTQKVVLTHPTGNANLRAIATGLASSNILHKFYTSLAVYNGSFLDRLSNVTGFSSLKKRRFEDVLRPFTHTYPYRDLGRLLAYRAGIKNLIRHEKGMFCIDRVYQALDYHVASALPCEVSHGATAVYAYEDAACETFRLAKKLGLATIYDLPIAYWQTGRKIMQEEADRIPRWAHTLTRGISDSERKLQRKTEELALADFVVVPSKFVYDSLPVGAHDKKIIISPFGSPPSLPPLSASKLGENTTTLRVLFVGSLTQRKGLYDLFEAVRLLNSDKIELIVMGSAVDDLSFYKAECKNFTYVPPGSHEEVLQLMSTCHIFCLPSIVEGRALVIQEAMSQGLPIIITPNTGAEDLVIENETGFLVPIRSPEIIADKLEWCLANRNVLSHMSRQAYYHAATYTWENYVAKIIFAII